jgi:hypothetical protein
MRRVSCQGSETTYPFPSEAAKATQLKASAVRSSTLPEFESWSSVSTRPPSLGSIKLGVAGIGMGCMQELGKNVGRQGMIDDCSRPIRSSSQLRISEMLSRVTRLLFESQWL